MAKRPTLRWPRAPGPLAVPWSATLTRPSRATMAARAGGRSQGKKKMHFFTLGLIYVLIIA